MDHICVVVTHLTEAQGSGWPLQPELATLLGMWNETT